VKLPPRQTDKEILRKLRRRVDRARNFPTNTCPASRHLHMMAEGLIRGGYPMLQEEPEHCAISILSTLEALWKARTKLIKVCGEDALL